jgi:hypothetical protein
MRALLTSVLLIAATSAFAQEKFVGAHVDLRTTLAYKVPGAALDKMVPDGWDVDSPTAGPANGFNLLLVFVDQLISHDSEGKPLVPSRGVLLTVPVKKKGADFAGFMVIGGFFEAGAPGDYGVYKNAQTTIRRAVRTGTEGKLTAEEIWSIKSADGGSIELHMEFFRGTPRRAMVETKGISGAKPDFFRIYRVEQAIDLVRSTTIAVDRVASFSFKVRGEGVSNLFDGTEQLIAITSIPWYSRQIYLSGM